MMKFYPGWFTFFFVVLVGLVFVLCGDNWFTIWLGFELTLMCFLPMFTGGSLMMEGLVKYFLVQVGGSSVFALSFLLPFSFFSSVIFVLGMFMKLGVFPFYSWVPLVMSCLTWSGCLFIVTIQKIAPLFVLCEQCSLDVGFLFLFSVFNIMVSGLFGYNQSYMRSLMAYSSISHTGWLVVAFVCSFCLFVLYLLIYFLLVGLLFIFFSQLNFNKVVYSGLGMKSWGVVVLLLLSVSGLPPFSMFYLKVGVLSYMVEYYYYVPFLLLGSMLSVYYYLTFIVSSLPVFWLSSNIFNVFFLLSVLFSFLFPVVFLF